MKLYSTTTPNYTRLYQSFFLPSIPKGVEHVHIVLDPDRVRGSKDYFLEAIRQKVRHIVESLRMSPSGTLVAWSDVDIEIYDLDEQWVRNFMTTKDAEIVFQMQKTGRRHINSGFFIAFPTAKVIRLFENTLTVLEQNSSLQEEPVINEMLLGGFDIKWSHLPKSFYARTQGWPPPLQLNIYHATNAGAGDPIEGKTNQLNCVRRIVKYGRPAQIYYFLVNLPGGICRRARGFLSKQS